MLWNVQKALLSPCVRTGRAHLRHGTSQSGMTSLSEMTASIPWWVIPKFHPVCFICWQHLLCCLLCITVMVFQHINQNVIDSEMPWSINNVVLLIIYKDVPPNPMNNPPQPQVLLHFRKISQKGSSETVQRVVPNTAVSVL